MSVVADLLRRRAAAWRSVQTPATLDLLTAFHELSPEDRVAIVFMEITDSAARLERLAVTAFNAK